MVICFVCQRNFPNADILVRHLKVLQGWEKYSSFKCCESSCRQSFQNAKAYKKHLKRVHTAIEFDAKRITNHITDDEIVLPIRESSPTIPKETLPTTIPDCNINLKDLYEKELQFILLIHNNNNFTRKDVTELQANILLIFKVLCNAIL